MLDSGRCRTLSPHECKEALERIYNDKMLAERRSKVCETMEHFIYRSMEKKYGLRSLAIEHTGCLLRSVEEHASKDNEVLVFHKIYRNEIDEEYRHVQTELRKSIREMLMAQIVADNPSKDRAFLQQCLEGKLRGSISEPEWGDVIKYLYSGSDSAALNAVLKRQARDEAHAGGAALRAVNDAATLDGIFGFSSRGRNGGARSTRTDPRIPPAPMQMATAGFIKTVLDFQLKAHENYLAIFRQAFDREDADHDGILAAAEFSECFKRLRQNERKHSNGSGGAVSVGGGGSAKKYYKGPANVVVLKTSSSAKLDGAVQKEAKRAAEAQDAAIFQKILKIVDPLDTKRITFSAAAAGISKMATA